MCIVCVEVGAATTVTGWYFIRLLRYLFWGNFSDVVRRWYEH